eukprot:366457-Chlamydomonas_euryale.AAC.1
MEASRAGVPAGRMSVARRSIARAMFPVGALNRRQGGGGGGGGGDTRGAPPRSSLGAALGVARAGVAHAPPPTWWAAHPSMLVSVELLVLDRPPNAAGGDGSGAAAAHSGTLTPSSSARFGRVSTPVVTSGHCNSSSTLSPTRTPQGQVGYALTPLLGQMSPVAESPAAPEEPSSERPVRLVGDT